MENNNTLTSLQLYEKKKIKIGVVGLVFGVLAAICQIIPSILAGVGETLIYIGGEIAIEPTMVVVLLGSLTIVGFGDFFAGFATLIFCGATKRNPIKEMKRTAKLPVSWFMCLGAFVAGPLGTASALAAYFMCGITMGACILAFTPLILSILSKFVFKEKLSARVYIGIMVLVAGTVISGFAPVEGMPLFYAGVACGFFSAICFSMEGLCCTYAADMIDEYIGCGFFRCFCSGIMCLLVGVIVAATSGYMEFFVDFVSGYWQYAPWLAIVGFFFNAAQYNFIYGAVVKCGPARTQAMVYTSPLWSIPFGLAGHAIFGELYLYAWSTQAAIGALVVVVGVILIVCKPSELLQLRDN